MKHAIDTRAYVVISPGRNEADYMRRTLDSMVAQSERPALWVIVDDGSTDDSPQILAEYTAAHDWIRVVPVSYTHLTLPTILLV